MSSAIHSELLKSLGDGFEQRKQCEAEQDYLTRLTRAMTKVPEATWNALSNPAQLWVNGGINSIKGKTALAGFPDEQAAAAAGTAQPAAPVEELQTRATTATAPAAATTTAQPAAPAAETKAKEVKAPAGPKPPSPTSLFRELVVIHPDKSAKELQEMFKTSGHEIKPSTAQVIFYEFQSCWAIMKAKGIIK